MLIWEQRRCLDSISGTEEGATKSFNEPKTDEIYYRPTLASPKSDLWLDFCVGFCIGDSLGVDGGVFSRWSPSSRRRHGSHGISGAVQVFPRPLAGVEFPLPFDRANCAVFPAKGGGLRCLRGPQ